MAIHIFCDARLIQTRLIKTSQLLLPYYKFVLLNNVPVLRLQYLYFAILLFSILVVVLIISMMLIVFRKKNGLHKRNLIYNHLEEWLMDVVLDNSTGAHYIFPIPTEVGNILQSNPARKILLSELMKLKKSLSGISGDNLQKLYNQLNLQLISLQRLHSKLWHIKAKGIQELGVMDQQASHQVIFKLTNHTNHMVRMEAQISMVRLQGFKGLQFFDTLSYPLTEWHQLNLLFLLANQPITGEIGIVNWLESANISVVQFALKLIGEQHANEFHDEVVKCLAYTNANVRREAIICLGQIPSNEAAVELQTDFAIEPDKNLRLSILKVFQETGSNDDFPFLQNLQHAEDVDIKLAANKTVLYLQKN